MSSSTNSVAPFLGGTTRDALEALGITQFPSEFGWYQVIGGLIVQGGKVDVTGGATLAVPFAAPYGKQVLGTWIQVMAGAGNNAYIIPTDLTTFSIVNGVGNRTYYWLSLGV